MNCWRPGNSLIHPGGRRAAGFCLWLALLFSHATVSAQDSGLARSGQNMVATVHPLATEAGLAAFEQGGNAVDAAVAAALMLGVVDGFNSGIGGGCFVLIRTPDGKVTAIDAREMAPAAATRDMFLKDGKPQPELSVTGPLASGVPGALAGYSEAVQSFGKVEFADLVRRAGDVAGRGFVIDADYAGRLNSRLDDLRNDPGCRSVFFHADGRALGDGDTLKQPDLAHTCMLIADNGPEWFYHGDFAHQVGLWMAKNGGIMTEADFAAYHTVRREPVRTSYRDWTVYGFPPPSSGGVHVAQMLKILERFDLRTMHETDPAGFVHVTAEAMKLAFADRAWWLGDPDFAPVPRGLVDTDYAATLAGRIDPNRVITVDGPGDPPDAVNNTFGKGDGPEKHTTHIAAADAEGNWVAITTTVNTTFGSCVIVPGTGVVLNNQMDDFAIAPGTPNSFGLVGNQSNAVAPGKRPLSSMSPTIICRGDEPVLTVGGAGGPKIITATLLTIIRHLDLGEELDAALGNPRFHHQWRPDRLLLEHGQPDSVVARLRELGHSVTVASPGNGLAACQAIRWDENEKVFVGMAEPRTRGTAGGK